MSAAPIRPVNSMQTPHDTAANGTACTWYALRTPRGGRTGREDAGRSRLLSRGAVQMCVEPEHPAGAPPQRQGETPPPTPQPPRTVLLPSAGPRVIRHLDRWIYTPQGGPEEAKLARWLLALVNAKFGCGSSYPSPRCLSVTELMAGVERAALQAGGGGGGGTVKPRALPLLSRAFPKPASSTPWGSQACRGSCTSAEARSWS